jgi:hypothetical protein
MKQCNSCNEWKEEEDFNWRYKSLGIRHPTCKECQRRFRRNWYEGSAKDRHLQNVKERKIRVREEAKEFVYQYLLTHPFESCGEPDPRVLEFHHIGEKDKEISVMIGAGYSRESILTEISKCIVLCSNCHRRLTSNERGWFRGRK